ncbi:FDS protein [Hymenopellis radicata]|nr:FDS protein [Hymenopellis radicata]
MADDSGSGAKTDLASWSLDVPEGWFTLGQSPSSKYDQAPTSIIVNPLDGDALGDVAKWEKVWDDAGSGKPRDYSLWRGVAANDNYLVIGGIFSTNQGYAPPTEEQARGIRSIRKDLVVMDTSVLVWNDAGSKAREDGSVWKTIGSSGVAVDALIPVGSHNAPFWEQTYSLNTYKVVEVN